MKIMSFFILIVFIIRKDLVVLGATNALNLWVKTLFPLLFPTFIMSDILIASGFIEIISDKFGNRFAKIFNVSNNGLYILLISMLCGSPTNAKNIDNLYKSKSIDKNDVTKLLIMSTFFNPFLIVNFGGIKCLMIFWISNIINSLLYRNKYISKSINRPTTNIVFNMNDSINKNINSLLSILGIITVFSCLINIFSFNIESRLLLSIFLELTNALNIISNYFDSNIYLYLIAYSFGGISIFMQIKSILKDTFIDFKLFVTTRCSLACICVIICFTTQCITALTHTF